MAFMGCFIGGRKLSREQIVYNFMAILIAALKG